MDKTGRCFLEDWRHIFVILLANQDMFKLSFIMWNI